MNAQERLAQFQRAQQVAQHYVDPRLDRELYIGVGLCVAFVVHAGSLRTGRAQTSIGAEYVQGMLANLAVWDELVRTELTALGHDLDAADSDDPVVETWSWLHRPAPPIEELLRLGHDSLGLSQRRGTSMLMPFEPDELLDEASERGDEVAAKALALGFSTALMRTAPDAVDMEVTADPDERILRVAWSEGPDEPRMRLLVGDVQKDRDWAAAGWGAWTIQYVRTELPEPDFDRLADEVTDRTVASLDAGSPDKPVSQEQRAEIRVVAHEYLIDLYSNGGHATVQAFLAANLADTQISVAPTAEPASENG